MNTLQAQCYPHHRFSTRYENHPTCIDCGGQKCNVPGCQRLLWAHSEGAWCHVHEVLACLDEMRKAVVNGNAEGAFEVWLWYQAALAKVAPSNGSRRERRAIVASPRPLHIDADRTLGPSDWHRECDESGRFNR